MGSNAYRTSHNPPTPELLDACDRLGMLVMDETRMMSSNSEGCSQLERMIRRDRNHPCVVIWSLGNEEPRTGHDAGARIVDHDEAAGAQASTRRALGDGGHERRLGQGSLRRGGCAGLQLSRARTSTTIHANIPAQPMIGTETRAPCRRAAFTRTTKRRATSAPTT